MWPTKWSTNLKDDKLLPDIGSVGTVSTATNGGSPYALPSFVSDHQGVFNGGAATSSSGDPLYDTINTMTQAQSTSIYTPPLGSSLVGSGGVAGGVMPGSEYSYSSHYSQYAPSYGSYGYSTGTGGLLTK